MQNPNNSVFWKEEPVVHNSSNLNNTEILGKTKQNVSTEQTPLPEGYKWSLVDLTNPEELSLLQKFLSVNYLEDKTNSYRFNYSTSFLKWGLTPPGFSPDLQISLLDENSELIGFISAIPSSFVLKEVQTKSVTINFLCIKKDLRNKQLAPLLIKEITRRVNLKGIWQAVYTASKIIHKPITRALYYHRPINIEKLVEANFLSCESEEHKKKLIEHYELPNFVENSKLEEIKEEDLKEVETLFENKNKELLFHHKFVSKEDMKHWVLPKKGVYYSYVVKVKGEIKGFVSFYNIATLVLNKDIKPIESVFLMYLLNEDVCRTEIVLEAIIKAKQMGFDAFNALDIGGENDFIKTLKFEKGDGILNYYVYNCKYEGVDHSEARFEIF